MATPATAVDNVVVAVDKLNHLSRALAQFTFDTHRRSGVRQVDAVDTIMTKATTTRTTTTTTRTAPTPTTMQQQKQIQITTNTAALPPPPQQQQQQQQHAKEPAAQTTTTPHSSREQRLVFVHCDVPGEHETASERYARAQRIHTLRHALMQQCHTHGKRCAFLAKPAAGVGRCILDAAKELNAAEIVLGASCSMAQHAFVGSTAKYCTGHAPRGIPITLFRPEKGWLATE